MRPGGSPELWVRGDFEAAGFGFSPDNLEAAFRDPRHDATHRFRGATPHDLLETLRAFETRRAWFQLTTTTKGQK